MLTTEQRKILELALEHYGKHAQRLKCIEELCEACVALSKNFYEIRSDSVITEVADSFITLTTLMLDGDFEEKVRQEVALKIVRLEARINGEKKRRKQMEELHG